MTDVRIDSADIFSSGSVRLYRQRSDKPFTPENILNVNVEVQSISGIHAAVDKVLKAESELAAGHQFAWNPVFGYVTARPEICGTGLSISGRFHLEGLHMIGDLEPVLNALDGLRMAAYGCCGDGIRNAAHVFRISNRHMLGADEKSITARVERVFADLVHQETNARIRLLEEHPRVFEDAISRSIAVLRSCRLLSSQELLDIVSPLRLAANLGLLDHLTRKEAREMMLPRLNLNQSEQEQYEDPWEKDRKDAILADRMNRRFKNVRMNALAREWFS